MRKARSPEVKRVSPSSADEAADRRRGDLGGRVAPPRRRRPRPPESPVLAPVGQASGVLLGPGRRRAAGERPFETPAAAVQAAQAAQLIDEGLEEVDDVAAAEDFDPAIDAAALAAEAADGEETEPGEAGASEPPPEGFVEPEDADAERVEDEPVDEP